MNLEVKIGTGAQAKVYLYENNAIKVFREGYDKAYVFYEATITSLVENTGLPIARVHEVINIDNKNAIKMDYIKGPALYECILSDIANAKEYIDRMVELQIEIHSKNIWLPLKLKNKLKDRIIGSISISENKKDKLLKILEGLPEGKSLCHGDFHPLNIIIKDNQYYVIDWIDGTNGCDNADVCRTYMIFLFHAPELAALYLETYCGKTGKDKKDILEWLPIIAAARLCEQNEGEKEKILEVLEKI